MSSDSEDNFDDLGSLSDLSEEEPNKGIDLFSDSESGESEKETEYTYVELTNATVQAAKYLHELYQKNKDSLPGTKAALEEKLQQFSTVTRTVELPITLDILIGLGVLSITRKENVPTDTPKLRKDSSKEDFLKIFPLYQELSFTEKWKEICTSNTTFNAIAKLPVEMQLALERILDALALENDEKNLALSTQEILEHVSELSTTTITIPPEDISAHLVEEHLIKFHRRETDDGVVFQVQYMTSITKGSTGTTFWFVLLLLLLLSPALLRKLLGFIN